MLNVSSSVSCHVLLTDSHSCSGPKYHRRNRPKEGDTHTAPLPLLPPPCSPPGPLLTLSPTLGRWYKPSRGQIYFWMRREGASAPERGWEFNSRCSIAHRPVPPSGAFSFLCLLCDFVWPVQWLWGTWRLLHSLMQGRKVEAWGPTETSRLGRWCSPSPVFPLWSSTGMSLLVVVAISQVGQVRGLTHCRCVMDSNTTAYDLISSPQAMVPALLRVKSGRNVNLSMT